MGQTVADPIAKQIILNNKGRQAIAIKNACDQSAQVGAFVGGPGLNNAVNDEGKEHQQGPGDGGQDAECKKQQQPNHNSGTSGTDGEFLSPPVKGAVIPAMTAEQDGKPSINPCLPYKTQFRQGHPSHRPADRAGNRSQCQRSHRGRLRRLCWVCCLSKSARE